MKEGKKPEYLEKTPGDKLQRESNPKSWALKADALTTRPTRRCIVMEICLCGSCSTQKRLRGRVVKVHLENERPAGQTPLSLVQSYQ